MENDKKKTKCENFLKQVYQSDSQIESMFKIMKDIQCSFQKENVFCDPCNKLKEYDGIYIKEDEKLILCYDKLDTIHDLKRVFKHEFVHAFDICTTNFDEKDCNQLACTEIRASHLSGECNKSQEILRGNFKNTMEDCIKRRSNLSLKAHSQCREKSMEIIERVFEKCFNNKEPFL